MSFRIWSAVAVPQVPTGALPCAALLGAADASCCARSRCNTATPDAEDGRYAFRYAVTYTNDTSVLKGMRAIIHSVLTTESFTASNGYTCGVEYNPSTCGATGGPEPPGAWVAESTCSGNATNLEFTWTVPPGMDIDLFYAVGHQHIGAVGIELAAAPPGSVVFTPLCLSRPRYDRGFVVSMSACDFRGTPRRLAQGTKLRVVSSYHAAAAPLAEAAFQLPWQGVMGYMNIEYALAPASQFGVITASGAQERPGAAPAQLAAGPAAAPAAPVCLARALPDGASLLTATNVTAGATAPASGLARSVVLARTPALFTMEWVIDESRCVLRQCPPHAAA